MRSTPLMMWKSPLLKRVTISVRRSGHFCGKSSRPMMLMASLNYEDRLDTWVGVNLWIFFLCFKVHLLGTMACWDAPVSVSVPGCSASNLQCLLLLPFGQDQRFCWVHLQPVSKQTTELGQHKQTCSQVLNCITHKLFENLSRHMTKSKQLLME